MLFPFVAALRGKVINSCKCKNEIIIALTYICFSNTFYFLTVYGGTQPPSEGIEDPSPAEWFSYREWHSSFTCTCITQNREIGGHSNVCLIKG